MPLKPKVTASEPLKWYGLRKFGYDETCLPLTGDTTKDQVIIESICFRIGHSADEGGLGRFGHFKNYVDLLWNNPESGSMKRCIWNTWSNRMFHKMCEEEELGVGGCTSAGKCSSPEQLVLMFDGSIKTFGEIQAGDLVMGDDSTPRKVLEVHRGRGEMFKVTPVSGDSWYCTPEHTLVLKRTFAAKKSSRRVGEIVEIPAEDFYNASKYVKRSHKQFSVSVDFPEQMVELDPRMYGIWLGDGHYHHPRISVPDTEVKLVEYMHKWASDNRYELSRKEHSSVTCPTYHVKSPNTT